jgi:hypothetical protein
VASAPPEDKARRPDLLDGRHRRVDGRPQPAVNDYIKFGKRGGLASNRREEEELGMLCLHILQSCLGVINTLMIQDTLALPESADVLTDTDRRGLTPIFHTT